MLNINYSSKKRYLDGANFNDDSNKKIRQVDQEGEQEARVEENKSRDLPFNLQKIIIGESLANPGEGCEKYFFEKLEKFKFLSKKFNAEFSKNLWDASAEDQVWHAASAPGIAEKLSEKCIKRELQKNLPEAGLRKNILKIMRFFPHVRVRLNSNMLERHSQILLDLMLNEVFLEQNKFELIALGTPEFISSLIQRLMSSKTLVESGRLIGLELDTLDPESQPLPILDPVWLLSNKNLKTLELKNIELRKSSLEFEVQPDQPIALEDVNLLDCFLEKNAATCFAKCEALVNFKISGVSVSNILFLGLAGMKNLKTLFMNECVFDPLDYQVCHRVSHGFRNLNFLNVGNSIFCTRAMSLMFHGVVLKEVCASGAELVDESADEATMSDELFNSNIVAILTRGGLKYLKIFHVSGIEITQSCLNELSKLEHLEKLISDLADSVGAAELKTFIEKSKKLNLLKISSYEYLNRVRRTELTDWLAGFRPGFSLILQSSMDSSSDVSDISDVPDMPDMPDVPNAPLVLENEIWADLEDPVDLGKLDGR